MSKAWGECVSCHEWTIHYIRTVRNFQDVTKDRYEPVTVNLWEGGETVVRLFPGKVIQGRRMLRECAGCGLQWWEILESRTLTDEERWPQ